MITHSTLVVKFKIQHKTFTQFWQKFPFTLSIFCGHSTQMATILKMQLDVGVSQPADIIKMNYHLIPNLRICGHMPNLVPIDQIVKEI